MSDDPITKSKTEARAGATPHMTRYILGISLPVVVILFAILLFTRGF